MFNRLRGAVLVSISLGTLLEDLLLAILGDDSENRGTIDPNG